MLWAPEALAHGRGSRPTSPREHPGTRHVRRGAPVPLRLVLVGGARALRARCGVWDGGAAGGGGGAARGGARARRTRQPAHRRSRGTDGGAREPAWAVAGRASAAAHVAGGGVTPGGDGAR